jgi:antitoxin PrlF
MSVLDRKTEREIPVYTGSRTKTGNSDALRFEKSLFRSHPEFSGQVKAKVIAPGYMLVVAEPTDTVDEDGDDPVNDFPLQVYLLE